MRRALRRVVRRAGGQSALGRSLGVRQSTVQYWVKTGRLPAERVLAVEAATGVSRHELRPDLYPRNPARPAGTRAVA